MTQPSKQNHSSLQAQVALAVRGEIGWDALREYGVFVRRAEAGWQVDNPSGQITTVTECDVARGMLALEKSPSDLQRWADILLAVSVVVEINVEGSAYGERLLEELWELSAGARLSPAAIAVCNEIVAA